MEGVMMKNKEEYAVAVRKPNNEIAVEKNVHKDFSDKVKLFKLPILRGILAFVDSMVVGMMVLNYSASFFDEEEPAKVKKVKKGKKAAVIETDFEIEEVSDVHSDTKGKKEVIEIDNKELVLGVDDKKKTKKIDESTALMMVFAVLISIVLSVALFMVLPVVLTQLLSKVINNNIIMNLVEGIVRLGIFIGYVLLASLMPEIKRTFMYHGAEHKTINCLEHGFELTVENVKWQSKRHKRCGTSFMLLVVLISLVLFMLIPTGNLLWRLLSRILLVPIIAGVSYEFIRLAGKSENKVVEIISKPGLWMQGLTTKEPDDSMIEVAIASVGAVFDWKAFLVESKKDTENAKKAVVHKQENQKPSSVKSAPAPKKVDTVNPPIHYRGNTGSNQDKIDAVTVTQTRSAKVDDEDDEILKALDKFFDESKKEKAVDGK